jgi:hypothetical protein
MLSEEHITKFQKLYKEHFGEEISRAEALEKGIRLLHLIELIYKPITVEQYERLQKRRRETGDIE